MKIKHVKCHSIYYLTQTSTLTEASVETEGSSRLNYYGWLHVCLDLSPNPPP